ncbi:hypothetical protein QBC46DRAFT_434250 [Diplogelasinospora grovesii]|uniref:DUF6546 domain-containing protein n=1 Tax=Diplogelasinospora grovesii TaxID=303347 RepID=A0AAN6N7M3_9PEZI|nr:hypothetical protein QBC46DRAFT_434250 [Diplogelasinospora grovesii]
MSTESTTNNMPPERQISKLPSSAASFSRLSPELRLMVLEELLKGYRQRRKGFWCENELSAYAAVSREWQYFFEKENFKSLILHQDDIPKFGNIVQGQRINFVKWAWLRFEVPAYDCNKCNRKESAVEVRRNNLLFTNAVWDLFVILSTWGRDGGGGGVTLELSAHSPSDAGHFCKELQYRLHDTAWGGISTPRPGDFSEERYNDPAHGWHNFLQFADPGDDAKLRVFGHPNGLGFDLRAQATRRTAGILPNVEVVNSLVIRRQFYRHFSVPRALQPIIQSLTQLREFRYEPWRGLNTRHHFGRVIRDEQHCLLFSNVLKDKKSLRSVSMYEDFDPRGLHNRSTLEPCSPDLGRALAESSGHLEELHAAHNIDAKDFFHAFWPGQNQNPEGLEWPNLKRLSLTSRALNPQDYDTLIQAAAAAARHMPKLEAMELWTCHKQHFGLFTYWVSHRRDGRTSASLDTTWQGEISDRAESCWREVAQAHGRCGRYEHEVWSNHLHRAPFEPPNYECYRCAVAHCIQGRQMLTETSWRQILLRGSGPKQLNGVECTHLALAPRRYGPYVQHKFRQGFEGLERVQELKRLDI